MPVLNAILPVLLIALLGYVLARSKFLSTEGNEALSRLSFAVLIPSLLFLGISKANLDNILYGRYLAAYFMPVLIVFIFSAVIGHLVFRLKTLEQSVFALSSAYSNATILAIPTCLYTLGEASLVPLSIIVTFHNFVLFSIGTIAAERGDWSLGSLLTQFRHIVLSFFTNPITMSLILGAGVNMLGIRLPVVLRDTIDFIGSAAIPVAFLVLGSSLSAYSLRGQFWPIATIVLVKLIGLPLLVWLSVYHVFGISGLWAATALTIAAMPVGIASHVFAQRYRRAESWVASSILISTVLSVVSLSALMKFLT